MTIALAEIGSLLEEEGTLLEAGSHRPFLLEGEWAWWVREGHVDLFAVPGRDGEPAGARTHRARAGAGALLLAAHPGGPDERTGLLAVGAMGTTVARVPLSRVRALLDDPATAEQAGDLLEGWAALLCQGLPGAVPPADARECVPGDGAEGPSATLPEPFGWVRVDAGRALLLGREDAALEAEGAPLPLSRRAWLRLPAGARVSVLPRPDAGAAWAGVLRLHALALATIAHGVREAEAAGRERLRRRAEVRAGAYHEAHGRLAATLEPTGRVRLRVRPREESRPDHLLAAARLVGEAMGVEVRRPPEGERGAAPRDALASIARASRIRTRPVLLREGWWREDAGPLLARREERDSPVALLPAPRGGYLLCDPAARTEERVTEEVARTVAPQAHAFYRPFPDRPLRIPDVVRFALRGCGRDAGMVLGMGAAAGVLSLVTPIATGILFNDVIPGADRLQLVQLTAILLSIAVATLLLRTAGAVALVRLDGKMGGATQAAVWDRLLALPMPFFRPYSAGNLAVRAMGVDAIRQALSGATVSAVVGGVFSLFHLGLLVYYGGRLAWWATGLVALSVAAAVLASRLQAPHERDVASRQAKLSGAVLQFLTGIAKLRVAGAEPQAFAAWARGMSEQRRSQFRSRSVANGLTAFNAGFPVLAYVVLYAAAVPLLTGEAPTMRTGDFLAFMTSFAACLTGMMGAATALLSTVNVLPLYEQARPILETSPEVDTAKADPGTLAGDIEVQHVTFRYRADGPPVLRDVTLRVRPGEFVAFVGPSGSGKSTLLRLLLGFETPEAGAVYYDGQELAGLDAQAVRRQIGVVLQNGRLMAGDIFTNIAGSSSATLDDAWEAARMAGLDDDIRAMPMGMHTVVSEGAATLSGGQRQRLLIARAIVQRPRMLFFDEATSALDNRTQAIVSQSLDRLQATRIVVAHRLSTIRNADRIYVVDGGRIAQAGTYDELMAQPGLFRELASRQLV